MMSSLSIRQIHCHARRVSMVPAASSSSFGHTSHLHQRRATSDSTNTALENHIPIDTVSMNGDCSQMDIADAVRSSHLKQEPLLLEGAVTNSDATHLWTSLDYLESKVGKDEPCLVEIGGNYANSRERPEITFGEYIQYMKLAQESGDDLNPSHLVYLAQNDLFESLKNDFPFPDLCRDDSYNVGEGKLYSSMIWIGPKQCVSPLHFDPLDNLLMQFVGKKQVILYPPMKNSVEDNEERTESWHYAGHGQQYNTSPVIPDNVDVEQFPLFQSAPTPTHCILESGDIIYIPSKWWHHVRTLESSVSVNVWWR